MPPEQAKGDRVDERGDIFGLGAILYEALTFTPPHDGQTQYEIVMRAATEPVVPPDAVHAHDPPPAALSDIVMRALSPDPDARYVSVEELKLALQGFLDTGAWFTRRRMARGELIVREGDPGDCAYLVEVGECTVFRGSGLERRVLRTVRSGELFGELALFAAAARRASVEAATDAVLLVVSREAVDRELPPGSWNRRIVDTLGQRFVDMDRDTASRGD